MAKCTGMYCCPFSTFSFLCLLSMLCVFINVKQLWMMLWKIQLPVWCLAGSLTKADRELIVVATSIHNKCLYCVVSHSALHRIYSKKPTLADQVSTLWSFTAVVFFLINFSVRTLHDFTSLWIYTFFTLWKRAWNNKVAVCLEQELTLTNLRSNWHKRHLLVHCN